MAKYVSKTYKLEAELVKEYAAACKGAGVSQASVLSATMRRFVARRALIGQIKTTAIRVYRRLLRPGRDHTTTATAVQHQPAQPPA